MTHIESVALDFALLGEEAATIDPPTAAERLRASREALQAWVQSTYHPENRETAQREQSESLRDPGWLGVLADSITEVPMSAVAMRWLKSWWARHPLRATAEFAEVAAEELIGPIARKHPWLVIAGAAAAGALVTRLRPWQWVSKDAVIASLMPTVSVASILHWVTAALHQLHPDLDEPAGDDAAQAATSGPPQPPVEPETPSQATEPATPAATAPRHPQTAEPLESESELALH